MSFLNSLKRVFGIETEDEYIDNEISVADSESVVHGEGEAEESTPEIPVPTVPAELKAKIFQGVVEIFNKALPDFLARSVDPEAEQRILAESLDASVQHYLDDIMRQAEQYAESKLRASVEASRREAERLQNEMQQLDHQRNNLREQQLSADRRRRALADRVNDLETQRRRRIGARTAAIGEQKHAQQTQSGRYTAGGGG